MSSVWYVALFQVITGLFSVMNLGVVFFSIIGLFSLANERGGVKLQDGEGMKIFHNFVMGSMFAIWFFLTYGKI